MVEAVVVQVQLDKMHKTQEAVERLVLAVLV
jgi:hypothetical protein